MKTKKNGKIIGIIIIAVLFIAVIMYGLFGSQSNNNVVRLNFSEKRWIETNKNKIIDIAILNNSPIFGYEGKGIFFSFLQDFESDTSLEFNKISYNNNDVPDVSYRFRVLNNDTKLGSNDLLFYEDNYVILGKENKKINSTINLGNTTIGVLATDLASISSYLNSNNNLSYTPVDNINTLTAMFDNNTVNYIIVPKDMYLNIILEKNYYINYLLNGLSKKYVLSLDSKSSTLNSIIKKEYKVWINKYLDNNYNLEMFNLYCQIKNINDKDKTAFEGKRYVYGYVDNMPYEEVKNGEFEGINNQFLKEFSNFASIEFTYKKYNSIADLNNAIKNGKVDIAFNYYNYKNISDKVSYTIEPLYSSYVILSNVHYSKAIDSIKGLKGETLAVINDTILSDYAKKNMNATIKLYSNLKSLSKDKESLLLVDYNTYNYYKNSLFRNDNVIYQGIADKNYSYIITKKEDNALFYDFYQYYLSSISHEKFKNTGMNEVILDSNKINFSILWIYIILIPILLVIILIIIGKRKQLRRLHTDDKQKFIDPLTSLKNRYYLSCNMQRWEENNIYPQAILLIDLNNLKDVNDAYGHEEGDRLIKHAANILINNQLENTDIVRTDGNEFTIYMVGYDENQVINYMRKLYRLFKELPYEYGASLGYSMIEDDIKTIDDAINEAVLDMITNKETQKEEDQQ
jgi:diguanylate cyclase (GGDEF)-like protein